MGIEPTSSAWEAEVLPLNYARCAPKPMLPATVAPIKANCVSQRYSAAKARALGSGFSERLEYFRGCPVVRELQDTPGGDSA